jgi:hypothetical protein
MKILKLVLLLVVVAVAGYWTWNYFAGPLKDRRDIRQLGVSIASCTPFSQVARTAHGGEKLTHNVEGLTEDGNCRFHLQTAGTEKIRCEISSAEMAAVGNAYADFAETIGIFGNVTISYNSQEPDVWNATVNSPACEIR